MFKILQIIRFRHIFKKLINFKGINNLVNNLILNS